MTKHTDTSRSDELEKCFNLGDCAWTVRQAVRGYVVRHLALIEILEAENERLIKAGDGDAGLIHWQGERIQKLETALREIARLRTDLRGDFSLGSKQSDIARAVLGEK